jgi:hypothetical protein
LQWEFSTPAASWDAAPAPARVGKLLFERLSRRRLSERYIALANNVLHWSYGLSWGAAFGIVAGSMREYNPTYGLPFAVVVWANGYLVLPPTGIYRPIWEYDVPTLAKDLSAHLAYGIGTSVTFGLLRD